MGASAEMPQATRSPMGSRVPSRVLDDGPANLSPTMRHRELPAARTVQGASTQKVSPGPKHRQLSPVTSQVPARVFANLQKPRLQSQVASVQVKDTSPSRAQTKSPFMTGPHVMPSCQPRCLGDAADDDIPEPPDDNYQVFEVAIPASLHQAVVSMGTSIGTNAVVEFMTQALATSKRVSGSMWRYWEKRRVQNALRRILESLQDCFSFDDAQLAVDLPLAFDQILKYGRTVHGLEHSMDMAAGTIDEKGFFLALESIGAMPRELYKADRAETFAALIVPTKAAAKAVLQTGSMPSAVLTRDALQKGLSQVPFNLPDFPVPTYLLKEQPRKFQVMKDVAQTFTEKAKGLDTTMDFLLTGIVSVEELQAVLPSLVPFSTVEDAVMQIIRTASKEATLKDWTFFVTSRQEFDVIQSAENQAALGHDMSGEPNESGLSDLPSKSNGSTSLEAHIDLECSVVCSEIGNIFPETPNIMPHEVTPDASSETKQEQETTAPNSEPLPSREVRAKNPPNTSRTPGPGFRQLRRTMIVDWNTVLRRAGAGSALMLLATGGDDAAGPCSSKARDHRETNEPPDLIKILSLELHAEGRGPYLAEPFSRCCEICCNIFASAGEPT